MQNYVLIIFLWTFPYKLLYFADNFKKTDNFCWNCRLFENCWRNTTVSTETFTENSLRRNFALHFTSYLSIALSKILPHSKTIEFFWNFDHISRMCNQINYRNNWFPKVIIILIMTARVLFFNVFSEKDPHFNVVENVNEISAI